MKRILAITLAAVMLFAFCPALTGLRADAAAPAKTETKAAKETEKLPIEGEYTLFAVDNEGVLLEAADANVSSVISLAKDGTGKMTFNDESDKMKWTEKDGTLALTDSSGATQEASIQDGIIKIEIVTGVFLYYAREGVEPRLPGKLPIEGEYNFFAIVIKGEMTLAKDVEVSSTIVLNEDGMGKLTYSDEEGDEDALKWTEKNGTLTFTYTDDTAEEGRIKDGIIKFETSNGDVYYAREGVDTEGFDPDNFLTDSLLAAFFRGLDSEKGVHLHYQRHVDYMDATTVFDAHAKGESYYALETTSVKGYSSDKATLYKDGTVYLLYPKEKKGSTVMNVSLKLLGGEVLMMDDLYKELNSRSERTDFTVEERKLDGKTFTVEVYPARDYTEQAAFYFDKDGQLVHVLVGTKDTPLVGESFFTVDPPDGKVDEKLFTTDGYTIEK